MAIRSSMVSLVGRLRSVCGAATDDVFQGVTYWSDEQLEKELDQVRIDVWAAKLRPITRKIDGTIKTFQYVFDIPRGFWVEEEYTVRKPNGEAFTETFTVSITEERGTVTFETDVGVQELYIDLVLFDWNAAAASVWAQKAAHRYDYVTLKAADYRFDAHQEYLTCVNRAAWHRQRRVKTFHQPRRGFKVAADNQWRRR